MNLDIGGGTTKIAVCEGGEIVDFTAADIGARVIALVDGEGRVTRLEEAGSASPRKSGSRPRSARRIRDAARSQIAERMAERLFEIVTSARRRSRAPRACCASILAQSSARLTPHLLGRRRRNSSTDARRSDFGDLGPLLAQAIRRRIAGWGPRVERLDEGIRATVVGASQYTVQVSGSTIFVAPHRYAAPAQCCR